MPRCANAARPQGSSFYSAELQPAQSRCGMNLEERGALFEATFGAAPGAACCSVQCSHAILLCFRSHSQTSFRVLAGCGPVDFSKWSKHFCMAIGPAESWLLIKAIRAECVPRATKFFATFGDIRHVKMRKLGPVRQIDVALEFSSGLDAVHRYLAERGITVHLRNTSVARAGPQPVQSERRRPPWPPPLPHHLQQQQQPQPQQQYTSCHCAGLPRGLRSPRTRLRASAGPSTLHQLRLPSPELPVAALAPTRPECDERVVAELL